MSILTKERRHFKQFFNRLEFLPAVILRFLIIYRHC